MKNNALLLSIRPRFADAIFEGTKRVELRRVRPRVKAGDLVLVYVTAPRSKLEGAFEVERVLEETPTALWSHVSGNSGVTRQEFDEYYRDCRTAFAIVVKKVWRHDPVSLARMRRARIRPPQSYHYLDEATTARLRRG